jgi:hypothetical protein
MNQQSAFGAYSSNFGFKNIHEFNQFCWLKAALDKSEYKLAHNFYIYDPEGEKSKFREIDFGIVSHKLLLAIEHKCGWHNAIGFVNEMGKVHHKFMNFFEYQKITNIPNIVGEVITKDDQFKYGKEQIPRVINSFKDTEDFYKDVIKKAPVRKVISRKDMLSILEALNCKPYEYRKIGGEIFDIFDELREVKSKLLSIQEQYNLVHKVYNNFSPINYLLSDILLSLEEERLQNKKVYKPIFHLHKMTPEDILDNSYPIYWVCSTRSQESGYTKHFQLGFHISDEDWYSAEKTRPKRKHITIKLAFFRGINKKSLMRLQTKLGDEKAKFRELVLGLNNDRAEGTFVFYRTIRDRFEIEERSIDDSRIDEIVDLIVRYDNGEPENAIPRSTEFIKVFDWEGDLEKIFAKEKRAREFLEREYRKLVKLYKFMIDVAY